MHSFCQFVSCAQRAACVYWAYENRTSAFIMRSSNVCWRMPAVCLTYMECTLRGKTSLFNVIETRPSRFRDDYPCFLSVWDVSLLGVCDTCFRIRFVWCTPVYTPMCDAGICFIINDIS